MTDEIIENIATIGPVFAFVWILTITLTIIRPQRFRNSFLLMAALAVTMVFLAGCMGNRAGVNFLMISFLVMTGVLFLVPVMLIVNGVRMIRRESLCPAHLLSLGLGIVIGVGEIAAVVYMLSLTDLFHLGKADMWILLLVFTVFYFSCLVLCFVVYSVFIQIMPHRMNFNYVIIHGCGLSGGEKLTRLLSNRVDKAIEIYEKCKVKPIIIPSGGQGSDEKISEARAMADYLISRGIPESSIIPEDRSATTRENLINSKAIIDNGTGGEKTALVSSNYHVYRCLRIARKVGLKCTGIGAKVALYFWPSALIREFIAVFTEKSFMLWALAGYLLFISPILYALITR